MSDHKKHFRRIRESEYFIKRVFEENLKKIQLDSKTKILVGPYDSYFHMWQATLSDKFYDMTTVVRLGTVIEICLKDYYQEQCGLSNRKELQAHVNSEQNIFQQVQPWHKNGIFVKIENQFHINPLQIDEVKTIQQVMLLRHLYAHNSGLLDKKFVNNYKRLTGIDICMAASLYPELYKESDNTNENCSEDKNKHHFEWYNTIEGIEETLLERFKDKRSFHEKCEDPTIYSDYESEDIYFFEPLNKIQTFISGSEKFFDRLYQL